jgi:superfamily II DNA or RNA helicase
VADGRVVPRDWQLQALPIIIEQILRHKAATLSAAPGAGKTIFAGLVFQHLHELDLVDRVVVFVPAVTLVKQWVSALVVGRHLELKPDSAFERQGSNQVGVVNTYQSLVNLELRKDHHGQLTAARTLVVLDEVHHVGEPVGEGRQPRAWARFIRDLCGTVEPLNLHVSAILNLSGTLWRSAPGERISTVRYLELPDRRLESVVDFDIPAERLIAEGMLRPVDLFRQGAHVSLNDYANLKVIDSHIADLDEAPARAAIGRLADDAAWRVGFIKAVLDRLEAAYRSLDRHPVKALIVATSQAHARALQQTADQVMRDRGLRPIAKLAISDEPSAYAVLEEFRREQNPGVLCTVKMVGEGYDCPDIAVIGFASNTLTPLYVRQVVARAQRVTDRERAQGRPIPAAIVLPDIAELVEMMVEILKPMHHEIVPMPPKPTCVLPPTPGPGPRLPAFTLNSVLLDDDVTVNVTGANGEIAGELVATMARALEGFGLRPADSPRFILAARQVAEDRRQTQPFDPLSPVEASLEFVGETSQPRPRVDPARHRPLTHEEQAERYRSLLTRMSGWWSHYVKDYSVQFFNADVNRHAGIQNGDRDHAAVEQLDRAVRYASQRIDQYCDTHHLPRPFFTEARQS